MNKKISTKARNRWYKSDISYKNYQDYLQIKSDRYKLTLIDLLYISNFKGGNATINEPESDINNKLKHYTTKLKIIHSEFGKKSLAKLTDEELEKLVIAVNDMCELTLRNSETHIDGFSVSYLSALLNSYFPDLIPIIDRRVLMNLRLVKSVDINKQGQIINIQRFYKPLFNKIAKISAKNEYSIREIDRELFIIDLSK